MNKAITEKISYARKQKEPVFSLLEQYMVDFLQVEYGESDSENDSD